MDDGEMVRQLGQLAQLHSDGSLTDEEFVLAKERLLSGRGGVSYSSGKPVEGSDVRAAADPSDSGAAQGRRASRGPPGMAAPTFLAGGAIALFAFFALPMGSVPLFGSVTGSVLASMASEESALALLWLVPIAGTAIVGVGMWLLGSSSTPGSRRKAAHAVLALASLVIIIYLTVFLYVQSAIDQSEASILGYNAMDYTGTGFWLVLGAMVIAGGGSFAALAQLSPMTEYSAPKSQRVSAQERPASELGKDENAGGEDAHQNDIAVANANLHAPPVGANLNDQRQLEKQPGNPIKRKKIRNILSLGVVLLSVFALTMLAVQRYRSMEAADDIATPTIYPSETTPTGEQMTVQALEGWQISEFIIQRGDSVKIRYLSGTWTTWDGNDPYSDANGPFDSARYICAELMSASQCEEPVPEVQKGALVARIGEDGTPFLVGNELNFVADTAGTLWLGINDGPSGLSDNSGSITVAVSIQH